MDNIILLIAIFRLLSPIPAEFVQYTGPAHVSLIEEGGSSNSVKSNYLRLNRVKNPQEESIAPNDAYPKTKFIELRINPGKGRQTTSFNEAEELFGKVELIQDPKSDNYILQKNQREDSLTNTHVSGVNTVNYKALNNTQKLGSYVIPYQENSYHPNSQVYITPTYQPQFKSDSPPHQHIAHPEIIPRDFSFYQPHSKPRTILVRRPAIQKQFFDIEEKVVVRPAGTFLIPSADSQRHKPGYTVLIPGGGYNENQHPYYQESEHSSHRPNYVVVKDINSEHFDRSRTNIEKFLLVPAVAKSENDGQIFRSTPSHSNQVPYYINNNDNYNYRFDCPEHKIGHSYFPTSHVSGNGHNSISRPASSHDYTPTYTTRSSSFGAEASSTTISPNYGNTVYTTHRHTVTSTIAPPVSRPSFIVRNNYKPQAGLPTYPVVDIKTSTGYESGLNEYNKQNQENNESQVEESSAEFVVVDKKEDNLEQPHKIKLKEPTFYYPSNVEAKSKGLTLSYGYRTNVEGYGQKLNYAAKQKTDDSQNYRLRYTALIPEDAQANNQNPRHDRLEHSNNVQVQDIKNFQFDRSRQSIKKAPFTSTVANDNKNYIFHSITNQTAAVPSYITKNQNQFNCTDNNSKSLQFSTPHVNVHEHTKEYNKFNQENNESQVEESSAEFVFSDRSERNFDKIKLRRPTIVYPSNVGVKSKEDNPSYVYPINIEESDQSSNTAVFKELQESNENNFKTNIHQSSSIGRKSANSDKIISSTDFPFIIPSPRERINIKRISIDHPVETFEEIEVKETKTKFQKRPEQQDAAKNIELDTSKSAFTHIRASPLNSEVQVSFGNQYH